jgi:hypothetical protein
MRRGRRALRSTYLERSGAGGVAGPRTASRIKW